MPFLSKRAREQIEEVMGERRVAYAAPERPQDVKAIWEEGGVLYARLYDGTMLRHNGEAWEDA